MQTTLIEAADLARLLGVGAGGVSAAPDGAAPAGAALLAVIDCRSELSRPEWGAQVYSEGHIPGAVHASLERDLSGPVTPLTGRHPLPDPAHLARTLGTWGIDRDVRVVAYDQGSGAYAARLWWLLRWLGHTRVVVLNGGFAAWTRAGLPVTTATAAPSPRRFVPAEARTMVVTATDVQRALERGEITLIDARGADRFAGQNETIDPVAGHVPGARNRPFTSNLGADGRFLPAPSLRSGWETVLQGDSPTRVVSMCGSGITACQNLLALELAGLAGARLYAGSWSEWIRDPARPIA